MNEISGENIDYSYLKISFAGTLSWRIFKKDFQLYVSVLIRKFNDFLTQAECNVRTENFADKCSDIFRRKFYCHTRC